MRFAATEVPADLYQLASGLSSWMIPSRLWMRAELRVLVTSGRAQGVKKRVGAFVAGVLFPRFPCLLRFALEFGDRVKARFGIVFQILAYKAAQESQTGRLNRADKGPHQLQIQDVDSRYVVRALVILPEDMFKYPDLATF